MSPEGEEKRRSYDTVLAVLEERTKNICENIGTIKKYINDREKAVDERLLKVDKWMGRVVGAVAILSMLCAWVVPTLIRKLFN